jgi:hypothetical protein
VTLISLPNLQNLRTAFTQVREGRGEHGALAWGLTPPYPEFPDKLEKAAGNMPRIYKSDPGHADGIRHSDLDAAARVLNEVIPVMGASAIAKML